MAQTAEEFVTKWGFQVDHAALDKMESSLESIKGKLEFLTATEVAKGLFEMVQKFSEFAENLHVSATSIGLTVEQFQKLSFSAKQAGVDNGELEASMRRLSRSLYSARVGGAEAQQAFSRLGISPDRVRGFKNAQDALYAISDRMKQINDPIQKAALGQELLGRSSAHMVGYLSQGSKALKDQGAQAEALGAVLSGPQIEALVNVEHAMQRLWALLKGIAGTIAAEIAPVLEAFIGDFIKWAQANREVIQQNIEKWLENVAYALGFTWGLLTTITKAVLDFAKSWGFDDKLLSWIATLAGLVSGLLLLKGAFSVVSAAVSPLISLWGSLKSVLGYVNIAIGWIASAFGVASSTVWLVIAAIAAVIIIFHDLWALLNGKPTWLGQFYEWAKSLSLVQTALNAISETWGKVKGSIGGALDVAAKYLGFGSGPAQQSPSSLAGTTGIASAVQNSSSSDASYNVNAPITVQVPPGTPPSEVGTSVREGVRDHMDRMARELKRSSTPTVAY